MAADGGVENERALVRAIVANSSIIAFVADKVQVADFTSPTLAQIYSTALHLWGEGMEDIDEMVLLNEIGFGNEQIRQELMGFSGTAVPASWEYHADKVRDNGARWRFQQLGVELRQRAEASSSSPQELQEFTEKELGRIVVGNTDTVVPFAQSLEVTVDALRTPDTRPSIKTGFRELDEMLNGGLKPGQMIIVAGRPGLGKSTLGTDILRNACIRNDYCGLFFSLEMSKEELTTRIISAETSTRLSRLMSGELSDADWAGMSDRLGEIESASLFIDDSPSNTMSDIRAKAKQMKAQGRLDIVVIDYLQLLTTGRRADSRQQEVSEFSRQIKLLAKECEVPVIAVAQLNRSVESRDGGVPKASDLRESGSLEQDADVIVLINRPGAYDVNHERADEVDFIVAKHRGGNSGTVTVASQLYYSRFSDYRPPSMAELL